MGGVLLKRECRFELMLIALDGGTLWRRDAEEKRSWM